MTKENPGSIVVDKGINKMRENSIGEIVDQEFLAAKVVVEETVELLTPKGANPDNLTKATGVVQGVSSYLRKRVLQQKSPAQISREATERIIWEKTLKNGSV